MHIYKRNNKRHTTSTEIMSRPEHKPNVAVVGFTARIYRFGGAQESPLLLVFLHAGKYRR